MDVEKLAEKRIYRIITTDFPRYFALVTRPVEDSTFIGPEGGSLTSSVVTSARVTFPEGSLTKKISVGIQVGAERMALLVYSMSLCHYFITREALFVNNHATHVVVLIQQITHCVVCSFKVLPFSCVTLTFLPLQEVLAYCELVPLFVTFCFDTR